MANPAWFIPEYYATEKLRQMDAIEYNGKTGWTLDAYEQELQDFRDDLGQPLAGETTAEKAFTNFLACNTSGYATDVVPRSAINVSPNSFFNVEVYLQNLATNATALGMDGAPVGGWTASAMLDHLYNDLHMSAWDHYTTVGMFANINPSNTFNTRDYLEQRRQAMNTHENSDGSTGWEGRTDWTMSEVLHILEARSLNPVMDYYITGEPVFGITPVAPTPVDVPQDWNPWSVFPPYNPYEDNVTHVEMTAAQTAYVGTPGQNTQFDGVWNSTGQVSTIGLTDTIDGGTGYNTLSVTLNAPWPGFTGANNVTNVGRLELLHGASVPDAPYTFDCRNIRDLERIDIEDNGAAAISVKNLGTTVKQVNIAGLEPGATGAVQATQVEFANPAAATALELGVENTGTDLAAAPVIIAGIENLTVNALTGSSYLNLQGATGVQSLHIVGGGDVKITSVPNGIGAYDASAATGRVNMAASNLTNSTVVRGGNGPDTLTLTQSFSGTPGSWTGVDALAINPGASATISAVNITGLKSLWVNTNQDVALNDLTATNFSVYDTYNGSNAKIIVNGNIGSFNFSTADFTAAENGRAHPTVYSNARGNATILATGATTLGGKYNFGEASGQISLSVGTDAIFNGQITAPKSNALACNINGSLANGTVLNVVDTGQNGSLDITAEQGVAPNGSNPGQIAIDSDRATTLNLDSGGDFALSKQSSLSALQDLQINLRSADADFDASLLSAMPNARNIEVHGGGDISFGNIGSTSTTETLQIACEGITGFRVGKIENGANIIADIEGGASPITFGNVKATNQGDVHLTFAGASVAGTGTGVSIAGADVFMDLSAITGDAFSSTARATLVATESINYLGAAGSDFVGIASTGSRGPSTINLGAGSDNLLIAAGAVKAGQSVTIEVDLGADTVRDTVTVASQTTGAKLGVYIDNFIQGEDALASFTPTGGLSVTGAASLLASFGISTTAPIATSQIVGFGSGQGVLYDGDLYGFSSNQSTMVCLMGVEGPVSSLGGAVAGAIDAVDAA